MTKPSIAQVLHRIARLPLVPKKRNNKSGYKGVCWCPRRGKWRATIVKNGKRVHLGFFDDPAVAHEVYATELTSFYGEFARVA